MRFEGEYFDRLSSRSSAAEITIRGKMAQVRIGGEAQLRNLTIKSIQNRENIFFSDGSLFILNRQMASDEVAQVSSKFERTISWLEHFSPKRALILSLILVSAVAVYRMALHSATDFTVMIFPASLERQIGENTYEAMRFLIFGPSGLPASQVDRLTTKARHLLDISEVPDSVEVRFHQTDADFIGANALAFPGGPIVITDELVELLANDEQVLSVIAHEIAHIKERHSLRHIVEILGISVIAGVVFGANETIIEEASAIAINLWALQLSRDLEKEADLLAVDLLNQAGINPANFSDALQRLTFHFCANIDIRKVNECVENQNAGWLSTHPTGAERLEYLNSAN